MIIKVQKGNETHTISVHDKTTPEEVQESLEKSGYGYLSVKEIEKRLKPVEEKSNEEIEE